MKRKEEEPRAIEVKNVRANPPVDSPEFFHGWCKEPYYDGGVYFAKTYALVELVNGNVELVEPEFIKFKHPSGGSSTNS